MSKILYKNSVCDCGICKFCRRQRYRQQRRRLASPYRRRSRMAAFDAFSDDDGVAFDASDAFYQNSMDLSDRLFFDSDDFAPFNKAAGLAGELPKMPLSRASVRRIRAAIAKLKIKPGGVYVIFRNNSRIYVGQSTNLPKRLNSHLWCLTHFRISPATYEVKVFFFPKASSQSLKNLEREYRRRFPIKFSHLKEDFDFLL